MFIENDNVELKQELTKDVKKEIIALANSKGGKIYIGINDDGKVIGVENIKEKLEALSGMIHDGIKSDLTLYTNIKQTTIENKEVIEIEVMDAPNKPYYLADKGIKSSGVFIRYGNTSIPANEETIKKLLFDSQKSNFETTKSQNQNLHFEYSKEIFRKHGIQIEDKFKALNIINLNNEYTNLALLISDECPYSIKCAIYNGDNKLEFKDRKEFEGSILKQVNEVFEYLNLYNKTKGEIIGLERHDIKDYPDYALRETLLNAIIHRDYNYTGSVLISLFDNRIEITSLGGLVKGLNIEDLYLGISETRNPNLANIFYRLRYVESFGTGIGRIIESYKDFDKKPDFLNTDNVFKVVLYNVNSNDTPTTNISRNLTQEERLIAYLKDNIKISRQSVEKLLGISKSRASEILSQMVSNNILSSIGKGRSRYYSLK